MRRRIFVLAGACGLGSAWGCGNESREAATGEDSLTTLTATAGVTATDGDSGGDPTKADDPDDPRLDVGDGETGSQGGDCPGGGGMMGDEPEFSYIWIANSPEQTVSKIDTRTGEELGRYRTGPPEQLEPSRTSVNLYGDVAVSNRGSQFGGPGGITKIVAREEDCSDTNGNGVIDTSTGPADVKAWGQDECVRWNVALPSADYQSGARPTAWEGSVGNDGCASANPRLWVGWYDRSAGGSGVGRFHRVSGDTGQIEDTVEVPWNGLNFGPYGGAVNKDGDFWVVGWQLGPLVRIDGTTLEVQRVEMPQPPADQQWSYGMALDQYGNPWVASAGAAAVYDVGTGQWQFLSTGNISMRGMMVDSEDQAWFAVDAGAGGPLNPGCGLAKVDVVSRQLVSGLIAIPGCIQPVGVSIDVDGFVWVVDQGANTAFKVDPDNHMVQRAVSGLHAPYTSSDMTGAGLNLVVNPPAG
jgi:hypothetical protein